MSERNSRFIRLLAARIGAALLILCCVVPAAAQPTYDYSGAGSGVSGERGFILVIEGILTNPRNADNVLATETSNPNFPIIPAWDDSLAGRLGLGYRWANGTKVTGTLWSFNTSSLQTYVGTVLGFSIGPPIDTGLGDIGTGLEIDTEITARTADLALAKEHGFGEHFILEWSAGFRYARYEETATGTYANVNDRYAPYKNIENSMFGVRAAVRATYRWAAFSLIAGVGGSFLDGEVTGESGMSGLSGPAAGRASGATFSDDGRSGNIFDLDVAAAWHNRRDSVVVLLGWEQQTWDGVPADTMRNLPGTSIVLRERDSVTFSGIKAGVHLVF